MRLVLSFLALLHWSASANAQWFYQEKEESAFSEEKVHLLLSMSEGRGFGFRCRDGSSELMFMLEERMEETDTLNAIQPKLLLKIDNNELHEIPVTAANSGDSLVFMAEAPVPLIEEIRDAQKRVAVAVDLVGNLFSETAYNVRGSTAAATSLLNNCKSAE